jgi:hypothetical protein
MGGDVPLPYAPTLIQEYLPNPERVIKAVKEVMYVSKQSQLKEIYKKPVPLKSRLFLLI